MNDTVIESHEEQTTESRCREFLRLKEQRKTLSQDLKEVMQNFPEYEKWEKLKEETKAIKAKITNDSQVRELKEKLADTKERAELLGIVIAAEIDEKQLSLFDIEGFKFDVQLVRKLKISRA